MTSTTFGPFTLLERLGRGGYAEVWKARQARPKRIVALKILRNDLWEPGEAQARFEREADAAGGLFHPHIATVLAIDEANGRPYIAMQLIDGPSLAEVIKARGPLPWDEALLIFEQLVAALDFAHGKGLIHRDVKPANIMVGKLEGAVLTDFGLVRAIDLASAGGSSTGQVGTPHYKPPELWRGEKKAGLPTPATDVYSLACVLVEMLSGVGPFQGDTPAEVMTAHIMAQPELPQRWPPAAPPGLETVIRKALASEREARYPSAGTFLLAIQELIAAEKSRKVKAANRKKREADEKAQHEALKAAVQEAEDRIRLETEKLLRKEMERRLGSFQPDSLILSPGTVLVGNYRILKLIGKGSFSSVYLVQHLNLGIQRAIKVLHNPPLKRYLKEEEFQQLQSYFKKEAQLGNKIKSPYIIVVYDLFQQDDLLVLVMEYAPGGNLAERIFQAINSNQLMAIHESVRIASEIADGLASIHELDVVHRDIKPSNILFDGQDHAKIADLGLAQIRGGPSMRSTISIAVHHPGTGAYMSPEQKNSYNYLSPSSDIYALGLVLFEMLTGRIYASQRSGTRVKALRSEVPVWLDELLARMLAKSPNDRPWDGKELHEILSEKLIMNEKRSLWK